LLLDPSEKRLSNPTFLLHQRNREQLLF